jgi:hypothetical protein
MDHFVCLFPDKNHIDSDSAITKKRELKYVGTLNACIDSRYREKDFQISYVLLRDGELSKYILRKDSDEIIFSSMSLKDTARMYDEKKDYHISTEEILSKLKPAPINKLIVGGFYLTDCVDRFAKDAYILGLDVLVDEDITDMLPAMMDSYDFKISEYPNYNPMRAGPDMCHRIIEKRKDKPWLWQFKF